MIGGGAVGLDVVEFFAERNADVSVVEMLPQIGRDLDPISKLRMEEIFEKHHVCLMPDTALTKVGSHAFIVKKSDGNLETLEFEYGFVCLGMRSASPVLRELQEKFPPEEVEIVNIGDSIRARRIIDGVSEGRNIINVLKKREYIPR